MHTTANMERSSGGAGFLVGLFVGAAAGAVVGLMLAPKAGRELRRDVNDSAMRLRFQALKTYGDASQTVGETVARGRRAFEAGREAFQAARQTEPASVSHAPVI